MRVLRRPLLAASLAGLTLVAGVPAASAQVGPTDPPLERAADWLRAQQQEDGGFELAGFPGFETPDAVLALAGVAQTDDEWDGAEARAAVEALETPGGLTPLDAIDDLADGEHGELTAAQAAKLILLVTAPLSLDATAFDPSGDGATDLVATMQGGFDPAGWFGSPGALNGTLFAVLAHSAIGEPIPEATVAYLRATQQPGGGWSYEGDPTGATAATVDTTAYALQALLAAGVAPSDPAVEAALGYLLGELRDEGAFVAFGERDPNATAVALQALAAAGIDEASACWRNARDPQASTATYVPPSTWLTSQVTDEGRVASPNDAFGISTFATSQAIQALTGTWLPLTTAPPAACAPYRLHASGTEVAAFGDATALPATGDAAPVVGAAGTTTGAGAWQFGADGSVLALGDATRHGTLVDVPLVAPVVGGAGAPDDAGYWMAAADGGVFAFGSAAFSGSAGGITLNRPVVGMAATPSGDGYWLVASDGGVFAYGDAAFHGSTGGMALNSPVVGMAATPSGDGYWLVAADGGVFAYGDAAFHGSTGALALVSPVVGMVPAGDGSGYWLAAADGGVFAFDVPFSGSAAGLGLDVVAITR